MEHLKEMLHLDIFDYSKNKLCTLYDSNSNVSGQAVDVYITTERNGWKELQFTLPCVCMTENGPEENFRLQYLQADYLIRSVDETETDWFIISEPKITHNAYAKNVQVTAGHISQLLKVKNLGLEFSDDAGNNVGTAEELVTAILDGTGWTVGYVYKFAEKNGDTKYRTLKASSRTGAFKLISMVCDLFDAKPIYHGDTRTVDIVPINPFSEPDPNTLPDIPADSEVIELHYGKNISNVTRSLNTENIVTKLYAYGSYGDKTSGYCGIDECIHTEYIYTLSKPCIRNRTYYFSFEDSAGVTLTYHFVASDRIEAGTQLIYSLLDPASMLYIWDYNNSKAYPVTKGTEGSELPAVRSKNTEVKNWFQFVMNFDYYRKVGLLTDQMIQSLAEYQRFAPEKYEQITKASQAMSDEQTNLSRNIGVIDFCKLDIKGVNMDLGDGYVTLMLNKDTYNDGVIYRTDYDKTKDNQFDWRVSDSLDADGDPINAAASILYIIHDTNPVTWDKAYLKVVDDENNPSNITLWAPHGSIDIDVRTDSFFLFSYNGINGRLGALESNDEAALMSLENTLRVVTVDHPVYFTPYEAGTISTEHVNGYGWLWKFGAFNEETGYPISEMYFAYPDKTGWNWRFVYFQDNDPIGTEGEYWYDWRSSVLHMRQNNQWVAFETASDKRIAALFPTVYMLCKSRDRYYQGLHELHTYKVPEGVTLPAGNYFIENKYRSYWTFTTTQDLVAGDVLEYDYDDDWVTQIHDNISTTLKPADYRFDNVYYHESNILTDKTMENGWIKTEDGSLSSGVNGEDDPACRTQSYISVVPSTKYIISGAQRSITIHFYNDKKNWVSCTTLEYDVDNSSMSFTTPFDCTYIRICANVSVADFEEYSEMTVVAECMENAIIIENLNYIRIPTADVVQTGDLIGIVNCISLFKQYADSVYLDYYQELKKAQDAMNELENGFKNSLGDVYREGWWQDANYVDGDEQKLYDDALDNLKQISKPEASYNINYINNCDANLNDESYGAAVETIQASWPMLSPSCAIHLVDADIDVNTWAFLDKLQKCYDNKSKTKITINTNLSTIAQHSFTDVMTNIANVASEMKGKTSYYDKTIGASASVKDVGNVTDNILTEIKRATDAENYLSDLITRTATGLISRVSSVESHSVLTQTAEEVQAIIRDNPNELNEFNTTSVSISKNGVAIATGGTFTVESGNFDVTASGHVIADEATINGRLSCNGNPVLTKNYDIYIGSSAPYSPHVGMLWIKPGVPTGGGGSTGGDVGGGGGTGGTTVVPENQPVTFTQSSSFGQHCPLSDAVGGGGPQQTMLIANNYSAGNTGSYIYTATVPIRIAGRRDSGYANGAIVKLSLNSAVSMSKVVKYNVADSRYDKTINVQMETDSSIWLGSEKDLTATISVSRCDSDHLTGNFTTTRDQLITVTVR